MQNNSAKIVIPNFYSLTSLKKNLHCYIWKSERMFFIYFHIYFQNYFYYKFTTAKGIICLSLCLLFYAAFVNECKNTITDVPTKKLVLQCIYLHLYEYKLRGSLPPTKRILAADVPPTMLNPFLWSRYV